MSPTRPFSGSAHGEGRVRDSQGMGLEILQPEELPWQEAPRRQRRADHQLDGARVQALDLLDGATKLAVEPAEEIPVAGCRGALESFEHARDQRIGVRGSGHGLDHVPGVGGMGVAVEADAPPVVSDRGED